MRSVMRGAGLAVVSLGLLGLVGCSEDNESGVKSESEGKTQVDKAVPSDYSQLKPGQPKAPEGYPGSNKGPGAGATPPAEKEKK